MSLKVKAVALWWLNYFLICAVQGTLVQLQQPVCPGDIATYRCSVSKGALIWIWTTALRTEERFSIFSTAHPPGTMFQEELDGVTVTVEVTEAGPSLTTAVATVNIPENLTGTVMTCEGESLTITTFIMRGRLPTLLTLVKNGTNASITFPGAVDNIFYQIAQGPSQPLSLPIMLTTPENISFFYCQDSTTFLIDSCVFADDDKGLNYILFSNNTWEISRSCGIIQVTCTNNGNWSENIKCPELTENTSPTSNDPTSVAATISTSPVTTMITIASTKVTTMIKATGPSEIFDTTTSGLSIYVWIGLSVGVAVAFITFVLIIIIVLLLCKIKKRKATSLEELELNRVEDDANEYSTLTHPTPARSMMSADAYDIINNDFTARQPPEVPSYGELNGNAVTSRDGPRNRVQDRSEEKGQDRLQNMAQDRDSDTDSHQYAKTKHVSQKSKSNDMMYSEVAMGGQDTIHPHLTTGSDVQYSGVQHGVRPEDTNLNLDTLLIQLRPVTDQYQELGVAAGLSQETIEEITSHAAVAFDGLVEVCDAWIRSLGRQDTALTWRAVSNMLQEIGQEKLARDLLKVYTTGSLPVTVDMHTVEIPKQATQSPPPPVPQRNDVDMDEDGEVAMATVVSLRRDRVPTESEVSPPPIPPFHPNEDQAIAVPPRPPKKGAPQPGAPAIPPKILPPKPSPNPTPEALPSLPPKPNKKA